MNKVHLLTGGNMGDRVGNLDRAVHFLGQRVGPVVKASALYETAPWGETNQATFLNQALLLETTMAPLELLEVIMETERELGRRRLLKNGPRIIDIDILFFGDLAMTTSRLVIPHPEIQNRRFALVPLAEIDPEFVHPVLNLTIRSLLERCADSLEVKIFEG